MGWLRGQQTDFPGTSSPDLGGGVGLHSLTADHNFTASQLQLLIFFWGGGRSTLTHCRSQLHCILTSTPDLGGGPSTLTHCLTADHNFIASQLQLLIWGGGWSIYSRCRAAKFLSLDFLSKNN